MRAFKSPSGRQKQRMLPNPLPLRGCDVQHKEFMFGFRPPVDTEIDGLQEIILHVGEEFIDFNKTDLAIG